MLPEVLPADAEVALECPTCGAGGQTAAECRRCRTDLRLLHRLEGHRTAELKDLARSLAEGRWADALVSAQYIHRLRSDPTSFRLLAVCQVLNHQLDLACATHRECRGRRGDAPER